MKNKIVNQKPCTIEEIKECTDPLSNRKWGDQYVCEVLRPADCQKMFCDGEPCILSMKVDTNKEVVEFPCSECDKNKE